MNMKTYKGFDSNMKCRGFQYEAGKRYEHDGDIAICQEGFHAISEESSPLGVFCFYPPVGDDGKPSRYCEVETGGETVSDGEKVCCKKLTIGAEIGIPGIIRAHVEWVKKNLIDDDKHKSSNTGYQSAATNTGDQSSAEVSGKGSVAAVFGKRGIVRGSIGCAIFGVERGDWNGETYQIVSVCAAIVDGKEVKADTWYTVRGGKFVEAGEYDE